MSLRILYPGDRNSLSTLASGSFVRQNFGLAGMTSTRITADTPDGALGGMIAQYSGNYEVSISDGTKSPAGFFINDAAGSPFENTPAVASGKCPFFTSMGSYETDIYETRDEADAADLTYAVGDELFASKNGLITKDNATSTVVVAVVAKAPTATDPFIGFNSKI
jgi:hypothetical protein